MSSIVLLLTVAALGASFCHGAVLVSGLNNSPHHPMPDPKGGCEYLGKYYEPGVISEDKHGDCQTVVTCMEGGGVMVGDSVGCVRDVYKVLTTAGLDNGAEVVDEDGDDSSEVTTLPPLYT